MAARFERLRRFSYGAEPPRMATFLQMFDVDSAGPLQRPLIDGFLFAIANGLHCAGMCGPFAAWAGGGCTSGATSWHVGRGVGYTAIGAALGGIGSTLQIGAVSAEVGAWITLGLAFALIGLACGLDGRVGKLPGVGRLIAAGTRAVGSLPGVLRSGALGALTTLLPCGLLWAILAAATISGNVSSGAATMAGFAAGSALPILLLQGQLGWLRTRLGPAGVSWLARGLMLTTAAVFAIRALIPLLSSDPGASCCSH